jgi:hypothetical protein
MRMSRIHQGRKTMGARVALVVVIASVAVLGAASPAMAVLGSGSGGYSGYWGHSFDNPLLVVQTSWQVTGASVRVCAQGTSDGIRLGSRSCGATAFVQWNGGSNWYNEGGKHWGNTDSITWTT